MITLIVSSKADSVKLFESIEFDRNHLSALVWANSITQNSLEQFIEGKLDSSDILYTILHHEDGPIGTIDLRITGRTVDLGFWIGAKYARKGFMKRSLSILEPIFNQYEKLTAKVKKENIGSLKTLESVGFLRTNIDDNWIYYEKTNQHVELAGSDAS